LRDGRLLAGQRLQATRSRRQFRLLDEHAGQPFLDGELQAAALAHQPIRLLVQPSLTRRVERTTENIEKFFANHGCTAKTQEDGSSFVSPTLIVGNRTRMTPIEQIRADLFLV